MSSPNTKEQISKSSNPTSTNTSSITIPIQFSNLFHSNSHRNSHKKENDNESFSSQIVYINSNPKQCVVIRPYDDICHLNSSFSPPSFDSYHHFGSPKKMFKILNDSSNNNSPQIENLSIEKKKILMALAKKKISAFLPAEEVVQNEEKILENEIILEIYKDNFLSDCYIDDVVRMLSFHPIFLKEFVKFHNYLMYSQGALPYESRHYIAIMAASRHKCLYLVNQQEAEFISQKGKRSWLSGIENIPQKLQDLNELNKLLCHQPWLINHGLIQKLLKNKFNNSWSITELIMAVTILIHFHAMSGFIFGCGINENYLQELLVKKQTEIEDHELYETTLNNKEKEKFNQMRSEEEEIDFDECVEEEDITENDLYNYNSKHQSIKNSFASNRNRSDSTGTFNRTLSNSSTSSCEIGIDLMLNEMKVIKEEKKQSFVGYIPISKSNDTNFSGKYNSPGNNTITNSPIFGHMNCLNDVSNSYKSTFIGNYNFRDENFNEKDIDIDDDSDLEADQINNERLLTEDESLSNENTMHLKKRHCLNRVTNSQQEQHLCDNYKTVNTNKTVNFLKNRYMLKYICDPDFGKLNFKIADQSLKLEYYTWENQGIRTTNSFYSDICDYLDKKFRIAGNMNFYSTRSQKFDSSLFRRAVWLYVHSLFGIRYDDYDYNQIKELIGSPSRKYIKILCSCPERVSFKEYDTMMKEFTHSEKVHINIVIMEARMQASILYFLRAINAYFSIN